MHGYIVVKLGLVCFVAPMTRKRLNFGLEKTEGCTPRKGHQPLKASTSHWISHRATVTLGRWP